MLTAHSTDMDPKIESFEGSFRAGLSSCRVECECGKIYFHDTEQFYTWEDGELEKLRAGEGIGEDYAIGILILEGKDYADACDCWHPKAKQIIAFLERHAQHIARYFELEKKRQTADAKAIPVISL